MYNKKIVFLISFIIVFIIIILVFFKFFSFSSLHNENYKSFVISKVPLKMGDTLTIQNTDVVFLDLGAGSSQFVRNAEFESFQDLQLNTDMGANLPILKKNLFNFLPAETNIPPGKRLFVLDANIGPIAPILKINDIIDVIARIDIPNFGNVTETILEAVKIVAIGNHSDQNANAERENSFLSFYLTPDEVKIISFMKPYSIFSVVLRNPKDILNSKENAVTFNRFIQNEKIQKIIQSDSFQIINGRNLKNIK